jgi:hypothetical protein
MKKLSLLASIGAVVVCAAVPASFNWSSANVTLLSLDKAEAKDRTAPSGVSRRVHRREYRRPPASPEHWPWDSISAH